MGVTDSSGNPVTGIIFQQRLYYKMLSMLYIFINIYFLKDASGNPVTQSVVSVTDSSGNPVTGNTYTSFIENI